MLIIVSDMAFDLLIDMSAGIILDVLTAFEFDGPGPLEEFRC